MAHLNQVLQARCAVPRELPRELVREQALQTLLRSTTPCVALVAASGYGKTTLLAQYARHTRRRICWLTAVTADAEVIQFTKGLGRAVMAGVGSSLTMPDEPGPVTSLAAFLDGLSDQLAGVQDGLDIVLDQAECLTPYHGEALARWVSFLPEGQRLLLSGQHLKGFPLARLGAAGMVDLLSEEHLRFSAEEVQRYIPTTAQDGGAQALLDRTEGWPVAVVLSTLERGGHFGVHELLHDALDQLPAALRTALPCLAHLETWTASAAAELELAELGLSLSDDYLQTVRAVGLPLCPLGHGLYRPHSLLTEVLTAELARQPQWAQHIRQRLAVKAERDGDAVSALRHSLAGGDIPEAERLARQVFQTLLQRHEFLLLRELSAWHLHVAPGWWREYHALGLLESGEVQASALLLHELQSQGQLGMLGVTALALTHARAGDFERQLEVVQTALQSPSGPVPLALKLQEASALISLERLEEGLLATEHAVQEARQLGAVRDEAQALVYQQYALQMLGRFAERERVLEHAWALIEGISTSENLQLAVLHAEALLLKGRWMEAQSLIQRSLARAERSAPVHLPGLLFTQVRLHMVTGELQLATDTLNRARQLLNDLHLQVFLPFLNALAFDLAHMAGDARAAEDAFQAAQRASSPVFEERLMPLLQGLRQMDAGRWAQAQVTLTAAQQRSAEHDQVLRAQVLLLAVAQQQQGLNRHDAEILSRNLQGYDVQAICGADRARLAALLQALRSCMPHHPLLALQDPHSPHESQPLKAELRVNERIHCSLNGQPLKLPLAKSAELLVWLSWKQRGSLAEILNDLWDGARDPRNHEYFRVVVRRLRSALKSALNFADDPVPYRDGTYQLHSLLPLHFELRRTLDEARSGHYQSLFQVHCSHLLRGIDGEWAEDIRLTVQREQLLALGVIEHQWGAQRSLEAIELLQKAVRVQPDVEALQLALIRMQLRYQPALAPITFKAYQQWLSQQYGVDVSPEIHLELRGLGLSV